MGGFNQEENHAESQWTERKDVLLSNLPSISGATGTTTATDTFNEYALRGLFYRVNYSYKDRYMVEANGRYDGTSRFPKNNRFGFSLLSREGGAFRKSLLWQEPGVFCLI